MRTLAEANDQSSRRWIYRGRQAFAKEKEIRFMLIGPEPLEPGTSRFQLRLQRVTTCGCPNSGVSFAGLDRMETPGISVFKGMTSKTSARYFGWWS